MKYQPQGTIRSFLTIPQVKPQDLSSLPMPLAVKPIKAYWENPATDKASPDLEAVEFYALNHAVAKIQAAFDKDEVLPQWAQDVLSRYVEVVAAQGSRLYSYMLLIVTRETRHFGAGMGGAWWTSMNSAYKSFHSQIKGNDSHAVAKHVVTAPPELTLGAYVSCVTDVFAKGKWGHSYGGPAWANISSTMLRMVKGETSMVGMLDTAYTLAHNGGPMFNKGMLYHGYSNEFIKILDVQCGGYMPEAILNNEFKNLAVPQTLATLIQTVNENLPGAFQAQVDWNDVEKKGAKHSYATEKAKMKKAPPKPVYINGQLVKAKGEFHVMPGVSVTMLQRVKEATNG